MLQSELNAMLEEHEKWVSSDGKDGKCLVLRKEKLIDLDFSSRNLSSISLPECDLTHSDFSESNLTNACLVGSVMSKCILHSVNAEKALFTHTDLSDAILSRSNFSKAEFRNSRAAGMSAVNSTFDRCKMMGILMTSCDFSTSSFEETIMRGSNFRGSKFVGSRIIHTEMLDTDFSYAVFDAALFRDCGLDLVNKTGCSFKDTQFEKCVMPADLRSKGLSIHKKDWTVAEWLTICKALDIDQPNDVESIKSEPISSMYISLADGRTILVENNN